MLCVDVGRNLPGLTTSNFGKRVEVSNPRPRSGAGRSDLALGRPPDFGGSVTSAFGLGLDPVFGLLSLWLSLSPAAVSPANAPRKSLSSASELSVQPPRPNKPGEGGPGKALLMGRSWLLVTSRMGGKAGCGLLSASRRICPMSTASTLIDLRLDLGDFERLEREAEGSVAMGGRGLESRPFGGLNVAPPSSAS